MSEAERTRIAQAARKAAEDAPPLPADVVVMLQSDGCPSLHKSDRGAA